LAPGACCGRTGRPQTPWESYGREEDLLARPLSKLLHPWCAPLPGPLMPWPGEAAPPAEKLPACRYLWSDMKGSDVDAGQNACVEVFETNLESLKRRCVEGGYGGFAFRGGRAYMLATSAEELRSRMRDGAAGTTLWLVEEVRLCAGWTRGPLQSAALTHGLPIQEDGVDTSLKSPECEAAKLDTALDNEAPDVLELEGVLEDKHSASIKDGQLQCLLHGRIGFELDTTTPGQTRILTAEEHLQSGSCQQAAQLQEARRPVYFMESLLVKLGLEVHAQRDSFLGSDAEILPGASLARCRELCLLRGFGGFALRRGTAYFRTAAAPVLRGHLAPSSDTAFYILTATQDRMSLLPTLWSPTQQSSDSDVARPESLSPP